MIFGLFKGYRFSSAELFGIRLVKRQGRLMFRPAHKPVLGQCIMFTEDYRKNGLFLIAGGIIANMTLCAAALLLTVTGMIPIHSFCGRTTVLTAVVNFIAVISNALPFTPANDGATFLDARKDGLHMEAYNRIMHIYSLINSGIPPGSIERSIMECPDMVLSSLCAELAGYRYLRAKEKLEERAYAKETAQGRDEERTEDLAIEKKRLEKYPDVLVCVEAADEWGSSWKIY